MQARNLYRGTLGTFALLVIAAAALFVSPAASAQAGAPPDDPFYIPPSPLPPGTVGDLIRFRSTTLYADPGRQLPLLAKAWTVLYRSQSLTGEQIAVSGTVIVPGTPYPGPRPIVSYAVGTHGMGDQCAPSKRLANGTDQEALLIGLALNHGWAVVVTDYVGLGTPGNHPFVMRDIQGRAVLDIVRAATRFPATGLTPTAKVGLWGYSEGGNAVAAAAEIAPTYAPELNLVGAAAGGVPADLQRVADNLDGSENFGYLGFAAIAFDSTFPDLKLRSFLNETGVTLLAQANQDCTDDLDRYAFLSIEDITTTNPLITAPWQNAIEAVRLGKVAPAVPMHLYHALFDEVIPFDVGWNLRSDYCSLGVPVDWTAFAVGGHVTGAIFGALGATHWLSDRFAGRRPPNDC